MKVSAVVMILFLTVFTGCKPTEKVKKIDRTNLYFEAFGINTNWELAISEDMIIFYESANGKHSMAAAHTEPARAADANVKLYSCETPEGQMRIKIIQQKCSDMDYEVVVSVRKGADKDFIDFKGCGNYLADYHLHGVWVLEELEGKELIPDYFSGEMPMIEIHAKNKNFSGFGGCNRIRGKVFQERELLRFTDISLSEMSCGTKNKEDLFLNSLQASTGYEIKKGKLYLSNPDKIKMILKKYD